MRDWATGGRSVQWEERTGSIGISALRRSGKTGATGRAPGKSSPPPLFPGDGGMKETAWRWATCAAERVTTMSRSTRRIHMNTSPGTRGHAEQRKQPHSALRLRASVCG